MTNTTRSAAGPSAVFAAALVAGCAGHHPPRHVRAAPVAESALLDVAIAVAEPAAPESADAYVKLPASELRYAAVQLRDSLTAAGGWAGSGWCRRARPRPPRSP